MAAFLLNFAITFLCFSAFAWVLIYCRSRAAKTKHGLTGTCHSTGGSMCASCSGELQAPEKQRLQQTIKPFNP